MTTFRMKVTVWSHDLYLWTSDVFYVDATDERAAIRKAKDGARRWAREGRYGREYLRCNIVIVESVARVAHQLPLL